MAVDALRAATAPATADVLPMHPSPLRLRFSQRQAQRHLRPLTRFTPQLGGAAHPLHRFADDCQPQSQTR